MRSMQRIKPLLLVLVLGGCATLPPGPSVNVLPAQGKSFDTFRTEDATCRQWAQQQTGIAAQETYETNVATGAVVGTAVGTGLGAVLGSASGHTGAGALIGAASGLLVGTAAGSDSGGAYGREAQRRYDNAYVQCMYSYGNQVPGFRSRVVAAPAAAPTPPAVMVPPDSQPEVLSQPDYPSSSEVYMDDAPQFIYSPALRLYVAVGVPYDLVFTGSDYLYLYGGRWYRGPYYNGPWVIASGRYFPPALRRYRIDKIRYYRDVEYGRYEHDREHFDGQFHRPAFRGGRRR